MQITTYDLEEAVKYQAIEITQKNKAINYYTNELAKAYAEIEKLKKQLEAKSETAVNPDETL